MSTTAHIHSAAPRLERPRDGRVLAGVSAAIARHLSIDPILVRIGFAVAATIGGAGFVAYVLGALLIPEEGHERPILHRLNRRRSAATVGVVLILVGLVAGIDALTSNGVGGGLTGAVVLAGLGVLLLIRRDDAGSGGGDTGAVSAAPAVAAVSGPPRSRRATRIVAAAMLFVAAAALAAEAAGLDLDWQQTAGIALVAAGGALVAGAFFGASPWLAAPALVVAAVVGALSAAGVAFGGPIGSRSYHPAGAVALPADYRLAVGELDLDLRNAVLPAGTTRLKVRVGVGEARVTVPAGVAVRILGHAGVGTVQLPGGQTDGTDADRSETIAAPGAPVLVLDAAVGFGELHVQRAGGR